MKFFAVFVYFLILSIVGFGQEIPKGANLIVLESDSLENFDLFKVCVAILKEEGYQFDQLEKDFLLCSTKAVKPDKINLEYRMDLSVTGKKVELRSFVKDLDNISVYGGGLGFSSENTWARGANRSLSTSLWRYGWDKQVELMDKMKTKIPGVVNYIKEDNK